jgi:hypothetical protein
MVPAQSPAFLRLSDGEVLGVAKRARKDASFSVVTETVAVPRRVPVTTPSAAPTSSAPTPASTGSASTTQRGRPGVTKD